MTPVELPPVPDSPADTPLPLHSLGGQRALRIVHVVSSLQVGGMEQFVLRIAAEQQRQGHRVFIAGLQEGPLLEEAVRLGLEATVWQGRKDRRVLRALSTLGRWRPQVAHAHNPGALSYALLARLSTRARVVMTRHGQEPKRIGGLLHWRCTDAVVAVSAAAAAAMQDRYPAHARKILVIPNGVHQVGAARRREEIRADLGLVDRVVGIVVARLHPLKGHASLLQALHRLHETPLPLTLLLAGDGPERENIEALARELQLGPERLRLLGYRADVSDLLSASDFFVLPSLTEGLPLSVLEAMSHALPVVATPVGGIPEVITDGVDGLLVPVNDPEELSEAMAALARSPALRQSLGQAGRRHARDRFSFERMAEQYEDLYRRILAGSI